MFLLLFIFESISVFYLLFSLTLSCSFISLEVAARLLFLPSPCPYLFL